MAKSDSNEILASLAAICAILAFGFGFPICGWIFTVKGIVDLICACIRAYWEDATDKGLREMYRQQRKEPNP